MKKISLLLLTTLMVTSAYSGGPTDDDNALSEAQFVQLTDLGAFGGGTVGPDGSDVDANADVRLHDSAALRAAGGEEVAAPEEEARDGAVVSSEKFPFDICEFFRTVREGAQATIQGARNQLQRVPKLECPCVKRRLKQGEAAVDELVLEAKSWFDAVKIRHDEARDKRKSKEAVEGEDVVALRRELAASEAKRAQQDKQLAELRSKIEAFRPLLEVLGEQQ